MLLGRNHAIQLLNDLILTLTLRQLLDIGILPVLQNMVSIIISCLMDKNIFGHYDIVELFITGDILKTQEHNDAYHWFIISQMKKELASQIRENTYSTKFEISLQTSEQQKSTSTNGIGERYFCYDTFLKGELRKVYSKTYYLNINNTSQARDLVFRGDQVHERQTQIKAITGKGTILCK